MIHLFATLLRMGRSNWNPVSRPFAAFREICPVGKVETRIARVAAVERAALSIEHTDLREVGVVGDDLVQLIIDGVSTDGVCAGQQ